MKNLSIKTLCLTIVSLILAVSFAGVSYSKPAEVKPSQVERIRILSPNNAPLKIVVVDMGQSNEKLVRNIVRTAKEINEEMKLPKEETIRVFIICARRELSLKALERGGIESETLKKYVEFADDIAAFNDPWLQDFGEIAMAKMKKEDEPKLLVIDSNRGQGLAEVPEALAKYWNCRFMKINPELTGGGDHGGNIEVTPDDVMIIGSHASKELIALFEKLGYKDRMAVVDTDWLAVGHCDEYISIAPNAKSPSGYTIFVADPTLAFEIIKRADEKDILEGTSGRYAKSLAMIKRVLAGKDIKGIMDDEDEAKEMAKRAKDIIASNKRIKKIIDANIDILMKTVDNARGTPDGMHSVVPLPVFFWEGRTKKSLAFLPDVVNLLSVRDHLIIPDPQCSVFADYIRGIVKKAGFKAHFVEDMFYHDLMGEIHCGTNVLRHPNRYVVPPSYLPELYKRFMKERVVRDVKKDRTMRVLNEGK